MEFFLKLQDLIPKSPIACVTKEVVCNGTQAGIPWAAVVTERHVVLQYDLTFFFIATPIALILNET